MGIAGLIQVLSLEGAAHDIRVNGLAPAAGHPHVGANTWATALPACHRRSKHAASAGQPRGARPRWRQCPQSHDPLRRVRQLRTGAYHPDPGHPRRDLRGHGRPRRGFARGRLANAAATLSPNIRACRLRSNCARQVSTSLRCRAEIEASDRIAKPARLEPERSTTVSAGSRRAGGSSSQQDTHGIRPRPVEDRRRHAAVVEDDSRPSPAGGPGAASGRRDRRWSARFRRCPPASSAPPPESHCSTRSEAASASGSSAPPSAIAASSARRRAPASG